MWLFRNRRERLNAGMVSSMQYLYLDSEVWSGLRNFIWREYINSLFVTCTEQSGRQIINDDADASLLINITQVSRMLHIRLCYIGTTTFASSCSVTWLLQSILSCCHLYCILCSWSIVFTRFLRDVRSPNACLGDA